MRSAKEECILRVLLQIRPDYKRNPAGDSVQIISTGWGLQKLGVEVAVSSDPNILLDGYDLVHIFNVTRIKETYMYFLNAQKQGKKTVVSPIYWNPRPFLQRTGGNPRDIASWQLAQPMRARVIKECDLLLPNGQSEAELLSRDFPATAPLQVIPNGFPDSFGQADPRMFRERYPDVPAEFVLCVARISARKNQLLLAQACRELGLPLVLIGPVNDRKYYEQIRAPHVKYLGTLQGDLLASAYAAAKVHALASWFETPGLSSLEAAACGTTVMSTEVGSPREYFKDLAVYMNPADPDSVRSGLEKALTWPAFALTEHIRKHFTWSQVAAKTLTSYQDLLAKALTK